MAFRDEYTRDAISQVANFTDQKFEQPLKSGGPFSKITVNFARKQKLQSLNDL